MKNLVLLALAPAALLAALSACKGTCPKDAASGAETTMAVAPERATPGELAPDVQFAWVDKEGSGSLHDMRGRVVLLEFWATW